MYIAKGFPVSGCNSSSFSTPPLPLIAYLDGVTHLLRVCLEYTFKGLCGCFRILFFLLLLRLKLINNSFEGKSRVRPVLEKVAEVYRHTYCIVAKRWCSQSPR